MSGDGSSPARVGSEGTMSHVEGGVPRRSVRRARRGQFAARRRAKPTLMELETRALMSTFTVTNPSDSGPGSLRYEVGLANASSGANTINFDPVAFGAPQTITLTGSPIEL